MPAFDYELVVLSPKLETSNEGKNIGDTNGVGPLGIGVQEELGDLRGGKDSPKRENVEQILERI